MHYSKGVNRYLLNSIAYFLFLSLSFNNFRMLTQVVGLDAIRYAQGQVRCDAVDKNRSTTALRRVVPKGLTLQRNIGRIEQHNPSCG